MSTYRIIQRATPPMLGTGEEQQPNPFAVDLGGGYYHVEPRYVLEPGDVLIADDVNAERWATFPGKAPAHAASVLRANVIRNKAGTLRAIVEADEAVVVEKKVPQSGQSSKKPADPAQAAKALERAKKLAAEDPDVQTVSVPMSAVRDGDVVDADMVVPHNWN